VRDDSHARVRVSGAAAPGDASARASRPEAPTPGGRTPAVTPRGLGRRVLRDVATATPERVRPAGPARVRSQRLHPHVRAGPRSAALSPGPHATADAIVRCTAGRGRRRARRRRGCRRRGCRRRCRRRAGRAGRAGSRASQASARRTLAGWPAGWPAVGRTRAGPSVARCTLPGSGAPVADRVPSGPRLPPSGPRVWRFSRPRRCRAGSGFVPRRLPTGCGARTRARLVPCRAAAARAGADVDVARARGGAGPAGFRRVGPRARSPGGPQHRRRVPSSARISTARTPVGVPPGRRAGRRRDAHRRADRPVPPDGRRPRRPACCSLSSSAVPLCRRHTVRGHAAPGPCRAGAAAAGQLARRMSRRRGALGAPAARSRWRGRALRASSHGCP
jgi:hypothetical protein